MIERDLLIFVKVGLKLNRSLAQFFSFLHLRLFFALVCIELHWSGCRRNIVDGMGINGRLLRHGSVELCSV